MHQPLIKQAFSSAIHNLKKQLQAPLKHVKRNLEPSAVNYSRMTNTTEEAFDEVAHEWQALLTNNPFDVNVFNYLENAQAANFGTVDNPLVVFTSETPFRYVGCTGQMNEDDYEGHEMMYFMLREGPLQRCMGCGQVFKLVRLRNEYSPEMDYYLSNFHSLDSIEFGESDTAYMMSPWKYSSHYDYSQFETPSNMVYSMINPDEHDRLLVDPAYRLERTKQLEEKTKVFVKSLQSVEQKFKEKYNDGNRIPMNKLTYETLIDVEKTILKLDRHLMRVRRFECRAFLDKANHERREKRMQERSDKRNIDNYAFFVGQLTEEEQKYKDYYQTDAENEDEVQEQLLDQNEIFESGRYLGSKFDFQEVYTKAPTVDSTSLVRKKIFKFKYRRINEPVEIYNRRNKRMIDRQRLRFQNPKYIQVFNNIEGGLHEKTHSKYIDLMVNESINMYNDYYESDEGDDFLPLNQLSINQKIELIGNFKNHCIPEVDNSKYQLIPKRQWNSEFGVLENIFMEIQDYQMIIQPKAYSFAQNYQLDNIIPLSEQEMIDSGLIEGKLLHEHEEK